MRQLTVLLVLPLTFIYLNMRGPNKYIELNKFDQYKTEVCPNIESIVDLFT